MAVAAGPCQSDFEPSIRRQAAFATTRRLPDPLANTALPPESFPRACRISAAGSATESRSRTPVAIRHRRRPKTRLHDRPGCAQAARPSAETNSRRDGRLRDGRARPASRYSGRTARGRPCLVRPTRAASCRRAVRHAKAAPASQDGCRPIPQSRPSVPRAMPSRARSRRARVAAWRDWSAWRRRWGPARKRFGRLASRRPSVAPHAASAHSCCAPAGYAVRIARPLRRLRARAADPYSCGKRA